ncbi:MAG TPA: hypothetical protein VHI10_01150, partial [Mycobacterium sp.]|nr:hypothetical protein [Mycobacterium sp.]
MTDDLERTAVRALVEEITPAPADAVLAAFVRSFHAANRVVMRIRKDRLIRTAHDLTGGDLGFVSRFSRRRTARGWWHRRRSAGATPRAADELM